MGPSAVNWGMFMLGPVRQDGRGITQATFFRAEGAPAEYRIRIDGVSPVGASDGLVYGHRVLRPHVRQAEQLREKAHRGFGRSPVVIWPGFADSRDEVAALPDRVDQRQHRQDP